MSDILFNKAGVPLIGYGTRGAFMTTTGVPAQKPKTTEPKDTEQDKTSVDNIYISDWGAGNKDIKPELKTATSTVKLKMKISLIFSLIM